tara:strand:- start:11042 stop:11641 length:600 start_codon:yes stop_codon:yes gene_type:complete
MKKLLSILALSVACVTALHAEGFYTQFELGAGRLHGKPTFDQVANTSYDNGPSNEFVAAIAVGYQFDITDSFSFGPELGYKYVGKSTVKIDGDEDFSQKLDIVDLLGVATYHATDKVDVFGKAGIAVTHDDVSDTVAGQTVSDDATRVLPELALGAGYSVTENIQVIGTVSHIFGKAFDDNEKNVPSVTMATVGLKYMF